MKGKPKRPHNRTIRKTGTSFKAGRGTEPVDFAVSLSASMAGQSPEKYTSDREYALKQLEKLEEASIRLRVETPEDYNRGMQLKGVLSSLYCYAFNTKNKSFDKVAEIETRVGMKLAAYAKKQTVKGDINLFARYMTWGKWYTGDDELRKYMLRVLAKHGILFRGEKHLFVGGLHRKVGDNVFTVDRMGRQHRTYRGSCALQAFPTSRRDDVDLASKAGLNPPMMPDYFEPTYTGDWKGCARSFALSHDDRAKILDLKNLLERGGTYRFHQPEFTFTQREMRRNLKQALLKGYARLTDLDEAYALKAINSGEYEKFKEYIKTHREMFK